MSAGNKAPAGRASIKSISHSCHPLLNKAMNELFFLFQSRMCELESGQHYTRISAEFLQPVSSYKLIRLQTLKKFNTHHLNLE